MLRIRMVPAPVGRWRTRHDRGCGLGRVGRAVRSVTARRRLGRAVVQARALRMAGSYRSAGTCLQRAIARYEVRPEVDPVGLGVALNEFGMIGKYSGDFDEAERAYLGALRLFERCGPGGDSGRAATVLHNLGGLAHARGRFVEAAAFARRGIAVRESSGGIGSAQLIDDRAALAAILVDLGHLDEARAVLVGVIAQREALTHADPFEVAVALHNLGSLQFRSGLVTEARQTFERTFALKRATLPPGHPDLAITLHNLACCLERLGEPAAATHHLRRGVDVLAPVVADDHPTLAALRAKLDRHRCPPSARS
jgi:tetratricopeptide (TPR) repeat protein